MLKNAFFGGLDYAEKCTDEERAILNLHLDKQLFCSPSL